VRAPRRFSVQNRYFGRHIYNFRGKFSHLTFRSQYCRHHFRVTPKQLFQPLKPLQFIFTPSIFNPEYFRIERMSYKNISICLSELRAYEIGLKKNLDAEKSEKGDFSQLPAHQGRVAKSAMVFQSIESTKMKLSHVSPSIQRLRRVGTRDLSQFSSPESVSATQSSSTKPPKLPPLPRLPTFWAPTYRNPATIPKKVLPQLPGLKQVVSRTPDFHLNDIGVQETFEQSCPQIWEAVSQV
jgi:hypothetical protein